MFSSADRVGAGLEIERAQEHSCKQKEEKFGCIQQVCVEIISSACIANPSIYAPLLMLNFFLFKLRITFVITVQFLLC